MEPRAATARRYLSWGSAALPVGLGASAMGHAELGSIVTVLAWAVLIAGLHTFGRTGPETKA